MHQLARAPARGFMPACTSSPSETSAMIRKPLDLKLKPHQLHRDVGKPAGEKLTEADLAVAKSKGGVYAKRAQFAENAKKRMHPIEGKR
jgi:hypothetical protein